MGNNRIYILLFCVVLAFQACTKGSLSAVEFMSYINNKDNGFIQKREFNTIAYTLKLEPAEYKTLQEISLNNTEISRPVFDSIFRGYKGMYYFTFKIESLNSVGSPIKSLAKSKEDLSKVIQYCQSMLQKDFYIESGDSKIECSLFHIEDDYSITNYNLISLGFDAEKIDPDKDLIFIFNDPFFNSGILKFNIPKETIHQLPKIKFS